MRLLLMLGVLCFPLSGCIENRPDGYTESNKIKVDKLAECVCSGKGGLAYIRYAYNNSYASIICHSSDVQFTVQIDDFCKEKR